MLDAEQLRVGLELLGIGTAAGLVGGLLGVGGGIIMIPGMYLILADHFGVNSFHLYKLAAISTAIVVSIPATVRHRRAGAILPPLLKRMILPALVGILVGVLLGKCMANESTHFLRRMFGGFLLAVVAFNIYLVRRTAHGDVAIRPYCPLPNARPWVGALPGMPAGLIAGLLGIGGGVWAVPAQRLFLGVRLRYAIANSSAMIIVIATATSIGQSIAVEGMEGVRAVDGWWLTAWLAPGAVVGGWFGAALTHKIPTGWLRLVFYVLLAVTGVRLVSG